MPITRSAKKAIRGGARKQVYNIRRKKAFEEVTREIRSLVKAGKVADAKALIPKAQQALDKAAKGNTLKDNTAARKKSRIVALVKKAEAKK